VELAGRLLYTHKSGAKVQHYKAQDEDCSSCPLKHRCLKNPGSGEGRQVTKFGRALAGENDPSQTMRQAIDAAEGRRSYSQRIATVEPVFANIQHHKGMRRFTLRSRVKGEDPVAAVLPGAQHREDGDECGVRDVGAWRGTRIDAHGARQRH
jgi:hypothetical protein